MGKFIEKRETEWQDVYSALKSDDKFTEWKVLLFFFNMQFSLNVLPLKGREDRERRVGNGRCELITKHYIVEDSKHNTYAS